jgi:SAM-dependent methyltransferase
MPAGYIQHIRARLRLQDRNVTLLAQALLDGNRPAVAEGTSQPPAGASSIAGSALCRESHFADPWFGYWCARCGEKPRFHRKQWEYHFICDSLWRAGLLAPGKKGLGFGVGLEPLPSLFASFGCEILATDMDYSLAARIGWVNSAQHASKLEALNQRGLCEAEAFRERVKLQVVDMNAVPETLRGHDFCWSTCAMEHLGSIPAGLRFVEESLRCLRPGGVAVHTTEFNLSSNDETLTEGRTVLFRRRDIEQLVDHLRARGHEVSTIDYDAGQGILDGFVDVPPYRDDPHLRLLLERYTATCFGLVVRAAGLLRDSASRQLQPAARTREEWRLSPTTSSGRPIAQPPVLQLHGPSPAGVCSGVQNWNPIAMSQSATLWQVSCGV